MVFSQFLDIKQKYKKKENKKMKLSDDTKWLNSKNCQNGDKIKFLDEGEWRESTKFTYDDGSPVKQLVFKVFFKGEERCLSIIKPSKAALIKAWGHDTAQWIGKEAKIELALNTQGGRSILLSPVTMVKKDIENDNLLEEPQDEEVPF